VGIMPGVVLQREGAKGAKLGALSRAGRNSALFCDLCAILYSSFLAAFFMFPGLRVYRVIRITRDFRV
jgi:hypothetical protein